jgi:lysophospholipid acyltransferase (LPLAT)-like uncharacterized protein
MFKRFLKSPRSQAFLARLAARYLRFVAATTRWRVEGAAEIESFADGAPCIVAFWHETLPAMPVFWLRAQSSRPAVVLASQHRDGQLIGLGVREFGIGLAAGSSSRGGAAGLRALVGALRGGAHVGLTPDGPRGPRRVAAPGLAMLAVLTGARILPCAAATDFAMRFNSWDRMRFPLPFGAGRLVCGPFITVPRENWEAALPGIEAALSDAAVRAGVPA